MKKASITEAKNNLSAHVMQAQRERTVITHHGKPAAILVGVAGYDVDEVMLMMDPEFWRMMEERRRNPKMVSLAEARRRLGIRPRKRRRRT